MPNKRLSRHSLNARDGITGSARQRIPAIIATPKDGFLFWANRWKLLVFPHGA
jgi:hypothetical protein